jgi:hypothetical protein
LASVFAALGSGKTIAVSFPNDIRRCGGRNGDWRPLRLRALLRRVRLSGQIKRADDQTDVTIGLRKIAQHAAGQRIKLFREQTHIIAAREQTVE